MQATERKSPVPPELAEIWMDREEACNTLRMRPVTLSKKVSAGVFATMRYGRFIFIARESVKVYLDQFRHVEKV
ncbi:helix-turn-helix domain-containing protein [Planctomicrobium piriforme]|uniref:Helix-turn-helix domain-containing protein n=1 Tax=Planctomicrobium piriforme TaxID=1576369 RepID=A0A1I3EIR6_9PLAN|nr:helix-turn-helix domain-containing protein [Planctomicrobium piriforme]SFH98884.1 hypothetical protein SAMN05421753_104242 [Planctomicrobium piriforme]